MRNMDYGEAEKEICQPRLKLNIWVGIPRNC